MSVCINACCTCYCPQGSAVPPPLEAERWERRAAASSPSPALCQRWLCKSRTWSLPLPAGSSSSWLGGIRAACRNVSNELCTFLKKQTLVRNLQSGLLVIFLEGLHQVPAALDVPPVDVRVEAGTQSELKGLTGDRLRWAVHDEITAGEALVKVTLLQVESEGKHRSQLYRARSTKMVSMKKPEFVHPWNDDRSSQTSFKFHVEIRNPQNLENDGSRLKSSSLPGKVDGQ